MQHKNFFLPQYFSPRACTIFSKFVKLEGSVIFEMYTDEEKIEFNAPGFIIFLPRSILSNHTFGKVSERKKTVLRFALEEEKFHELVKALGGTLKKKPSSHNPKLGDILKI